MASLPSFAGGQGAVPQLGAARAAILLLAMGAPGASRLLKHLAPEEIRALRQSAIGLRPVSREQLDMLVEEFQEAFKIGPGLTGPGQQMKELLQNALSSDELAAILDEPDPEAPVGSIPTVSIWPEVEKLDREVLVSVLSREHPQVAAVFLTKLDAEIAAAIIARFESVFRNDVMRRMLFVKPLAGSVRLLFESTIRQGLLASPERSGGGRHAAVAEIVNRMDRRQSDELLKTLAATKPADAVALRNLLFAFEDVVSLPQKSRFVLFDAVPTDIVVVALAGASEEIRDCVLMALGARARRMVEAELGQGAERPAAEVAAARRSVAKTALKLAGEGKMELRAPEGE